LELLEHRFELVLFELVTRAAEPSVFLFLDMIHPIDPTATGGDVMEEHRYCSDELRIENYLRICTAGAAPPGAPATENCRR